ncbi:MAG TPA: hypothetical protein VF665_23915 [Longimicrobium sp.]|jgi:hypothetical protein|uniref:hypothetical protein n=1 Tax=Longimicrobium sp. TaxID=2029185 RepID=UPI002EDB0AD9
MDELCVDAVAMVRQIRDAGYERLKDATPAEEVRYSQEAAAKFRAQREAARSARHPGNS